MSHFGTSASAGFMPGDPGQTRISGVVLDNQDNPLPGVSIRVDGTNRQAVADAQGQFTIHNVSVGNLQHRTNTHGTLSYGYDDLNRLTGVTGLQTQAFQYDANGNRTQLIDGADISSYTLAANSNRITNITGAQPKTYTYDANGNTLNDGSNNFTYNARNRMNSANSAGYQHNGLGQRVLKQTDSGLYYGDASNDGLIDQSDFDQTLAAILETATPAGNTDCNKDGTTNVIDLVCLNNLMATATPPQAIQNRTYFAYDQQGQLIGEYDNNGNAIQETVYLGNMPVATIKNGNVYYIHTDQLNTPRAISDANNITLWQWESTPFGETAANEDVDGDGEAFVYNLRFPGQYYDQESGLHYNYFRDYDPGTGRYTASDPIGLAGGLNTYHYSEANPVNYIDPRGLNSAAGAAGAAVSICISYPPLCQAAARAAGAAIGSGFCAITGLCNESAEEDESKLQSCPTPNTDSGDFENVKKSKAKKNKKTGEIWEPDLLHKDHWEVYKDKKNWEKGKRSKSVWNDGRVKQYF